MDIGWLYPRSFIEFSFTLLLSLVLDFIYPEHKGIFTTFLLSARHTYSHYTFILYLHRKTANTKLSDRISHMGFGC